MSGKGSKAARVMGGESKKSEKKSGKKKPVHKMDIRRASSGGYIVTHHSKPDPESMMNSQEPEEHAVPDVEQLQAHVAENMGDQPEAPQAAPAPAQEPVQ